MSEKQGAAKRKKEAKEVTTEKKAPEEKKDKADVDIDKRKPTSKSSGDGSKAKKSHQQKGINPCVILVLVLMLLSGAYVLWVNISDSTTGELEGSLEGSQLASTLRSWPQAVLDHQSAGVYVPVNDGVRGYNIFARSEGKSRKENEVVLLLHGVPVSSYVYRKMLPLLSEAGLFAVAFDFPGLGLSDKPKGLSYDWHYLAARVKDTVDAMDLGPVHLVLHDIAGPIGLEFAINHPDYVRSITFANSLINPEGHTPPASMALFKMDYIKHLAFWFSSSTWPVVSHLSYLLFRLQASNSISYQDYMAHSFLLKYNRGKHSFFKIMDSFDTSATHGEFLMKGLKDLIDEKNVSVQAVWVTDDVMTRSEEHKAYLASHFALKHIDTLPSKHFIQEDQPEEFSRRIISFVQEQPLTPSKVHHKKQREFAAQNNVHHDHGGHQHHQHHQHHHHDHHGHDHGVHFSATNRQSAPQRAPKLGVSDELLSFVHSVDHDDGHNHGAKHDS